MDFVSNGEASDCFDSQGIVKKVRFWMQNPPISLRLEAIARGSTNEIRGMLALHVIFDLMIWSLPPSISPR